jgi:hypothetical protein
VFIGCYASKLIEKPKEALESANFLDSACYSLRNHSDEGIRNLESYLKGIDSFRFPLQENSTFEASVNRYLADLKGCMSSKDYASACMECEKIRDTLSTSAASF